MITAAGIDVGSGAVKAAVLRVEPGAGHANRREELLGRAVVRIRRRDVLAVAEEAFETARREAGGPDLDYVATTGEGEDLAFATGHFYGMTTHARGALYLEPTANAVLDVGALHARAMAMDPRGKVLDYKMTSQCASGSGQFLENIARYLGVSQEEVGALSCAAAAPEKVSSICAVLAETDVINMVSRGISAPDILRGIHESMAGRFARLVRSVLREGHVLLSGGLANDIGLQAALRDALDREAGAGRGSAGTIRVSAHPLSIHAGAIGAALWGAWRHHRLVTRTVEQPHA